MFGVVLVAFLAVRPSADATIHRIGGLFRFGSVLERDELIPRVTESTVATSTAVPPSTLIVPNASSTSSIDPDYGSDPRDEYGDQRGGFEYEDVDDYGTVDSCEGDCSDMDNDGRTWNDVDADGDGRYESNGFR